MEMDAVINTGRNRSRLPFLIASCKSKPFIAQLRDARHQHQSVQHGNAKQDDKPDRRRNRQILPGDEEGEDTADQANGRLEITSSARRIDRKVMYRSSRIKPMATGPMIISLFMARCWFSN